MRAVPGAAKYLPASAASIQFLRFNQWSERLDATHEERERLEEEARFGGSRGDKGSACSYGCATRYE